MLNKLTIILFLTLGELAFSQSLILDTTFSGSHLYMQDYPTCMTIWHSGDLAVSGDINDISPNTCNDFVAPDYQLNTSFQIAWAIDGTNNLISAGDTIILQNQFFLGFDPLGNENMMEFRTNQQTEGFVPNNGFGPPAYFDRKTKRLYGFCGDLSGHPCNSGFPGQFTYRLNPDGTLDNTYHHSLDNGINRMIRISENRFILVGGFSTYDGLSRNSVAFIDAEGNLLPDTAEVTRGMIASLILVDTDSLGRSVLFGDILVDQNQQSYNLIRIDSLGKIDSTFHYWNFPFSSNFQFSSGKVFKNWIVISGGFDTFYGYQRKGIVALNPDGEINQTILMEGFTSVSNPGLGILPMASQIVSSSNSLFLVGNFLSYGDKPAVKLARFQYKDESLDTVEESMTEFSIYPNPAVEYLTVTGLANSKGWLLDCFGRKIQEFQLTNSIFQLNTSPLSSGVYSIILDSETEGLKFVKL